MNGIRVAIDGPSGVGKSTAARLLARELGYQFVDTGAMYRSVGLLAREGGLGLEDEEAVTTLTEALSFSFPIVDGELRTVVDGDDLSRRIRTPQASMDASTVSKLPGVRRALVALQQQLAEGGGVVMEGRDIGTVVMPAAEVKVFLGADARVRGQRRLDELLAAGETADLEQVVLDIEARDLQDSTRATSPLRPARDAIRIDTGDLSIDEVLRELVELVRQAEHPPLT